MSPIRQFYGFDGVPLRIDGPPEEPATAWRSHRIRLRGWLESLPDHDWAGATRCGLWDVTSLVRHLASGSQFLGYTLHMGAGGTATTLLQGFDPHATVQAAAAMLGEMTPAAAREAMAAMDAAVDRELERMADVGWSAMAEAPPGQLPAHLSVNHFLFDSWVHEYDLMVPRGERPFIDLREASAVVRYLLGLASVTTASETPLDVRLRDPEIRVGVDVANGQVRVAPSVPTRAAVVEGRLIDVVDRATGREAGPIDGDERALAVLDAFGALLAG